MKKVLALCLACLMIVCCFAGCAKEEKVVTVGYTIYDPMNFLDENNKLVGFDTELAEKVFGNLGYKVMFQEIEWSQKYTDLNSGAIDCIWNGFTCNAKDSDDGIARSEKVDFSYSYMENRQVVVVKKDSGITKAEDLKNKLGIAEGGSAGESYAQGFVADAEKNFKSFLKQTECLTEIKAGTADFAVVDEQLAKSYVGKGDYVDLMVVEALTSDVEYYAIGFKKGSDLTAKVNEQLEALAKDGTLAALAQKYGKEAALPVITDFTSQK